MSLRALKFLVDICIDVVCGIHVGVEEEGAMGRGDMHINVGSCHPLTPENIFRAKEALGRSYSTAALVPRKVVSFQIGLLLARR